MEVYGALVGHTQGASLGLDVQAKIGSQKVTKSNGYLQYDDKEKSLAFWGKFDSDKGFKAGFGVNYLYNDSTKLGFEASFDPRNTASNQIRVGTTRLVDEHCTMKERLTLCDLDEFRLGLVYKQVLSSDSKLTFVTDINGNSLLNLKSKKAKSPGHQFGVTLSFFD